MPPAWYYWVPTAECPFSAPEPLVSDIVFQHVEKTYPGPVEAVRGLDLSVGEGEFVVLVGPSGCGKSTTLRMVAGLETVSSGAISIGGKVVNDMRPKDRDVAMVLQNYALYPHLTVRRNMGFALKLRGAAPEEIASRIAEAAEMLGIGELLDRRPATLSGGQQQRVALGRAIVRRPAVFLLDEPLSNLDARLRSEMRVEIKRLHRRLGITMIYVTHDQVEALTLGERIAVLDRGEIQQVADPATLYDRPANKFVAGFIGTPSMNFIEGRIQSNDGQTVFAADAFSLPLPNDKRELLGRHKDHPIILGIRPEDLSLAAAESSGDSPQIEAQIDVVEPMGAESFVHINVNGTTLVARADPHKDFAPGQTVSLNVAVEGAHFFDSQTEESLGTP
jgi:multiple sugar transport system ATP-binding protein